VKKLTREGIPCSVRLDPIIPHLTDRKLDELIKAIANSGAKHVVSSTYKAKMDSFSRITSTFPQLKHELTQLYWVKGERIGRARYLPAKVRVELFTELKRSVERWGMTFATCREGLKRLQSGGSCDGSHLIPIRRRLWKGALRMLNKGNMALI
jgi:DNA repair photolyase